MKPIIALLSFLFYSLFSFGQETENVRLICNWSDTAIPINYYNARYNEVWGFVWNSKEYAIIGSTIGIHVIDVATCHPIAVGYGNDTSNYSIVNRDFKTYKNYIYANCDQGKGRLQVFDMRYLPDSLHLVYEVPNTIISNSHTIFIDTATAKMYIGAPKSTFGGASDYMSIFSLAQPDSPYLISHYNFGSTVHDMFVRNDTAYCSESNYGYVVVDCKTPNNLQVIGGITNYPYKGYNHSSWINLENLGVMADENWGYSVKVLDVNEVMNIKVLSTFSPRENDSTCIPHNPYLLGRYAFVSWYWDGLQIYDLNEPTKPKRIGYFKPFLGIPHFKGYGSVWGAYPFLPSQKILISDMQKGLYVLDVSSALSQFPDKNFQLYPNVVQNSFSVQFPLGKKGDLNWVIYDFLGKKVATGTLKLNAQENPPFLINLPQQDLPNGKYIWRGYLEKEKYTASFIIIGSIH